MSCPEMFLCKYECAIDFIELGVGKILKKRNGIMEPNPTAVDSAVYRSSNHKMDLDHGSLMRILFSEPSNLLEMGLEIKSVLK